MDGHVARVREVRNAYKMSMGKPERKRPFGKPRYRWEDNIKMDLGEIVSQLHSSGSGNEPSVWQLVKKTLLHAVSQFALHDYRLDCTIVA
jgi:hypothetical protein